MDNNSNNNNMNLNNNYYNNISNPNNNNQQYYNNSTDNTNYQNYNNTYSSNNNNNYQNNNSYSQYGDYNYQNNNSYNQYENYNYQNNNSYNQNNNPYNNNYYNNGDYNLNNNNNYSTNAYGSMPPEVNKWNWGAFMFPLFWGIGNKSYLALLTLIPYIGFIMNFICGALGNKWAYNNTSMYYDSPEEFAKAQQSWNRAGFIFFIISITLAAIAIIFSIILAVALGSVYYE